MKSLQELAEIKKKAQEMTQIRESGEKASIIVAMGTCGIAAGARDVMTTILDELGKRGITDIAVTQTGCIGMCEQEPLLTVVKPGMNRVTYGHVDAEKAREIIARHIVKGQIVEEWIAATK